MGPLLANIEIKYALVRFEISEENSGEMAKSLFPTDDVWPSSDLHVVNADEPIQIYIDDLDRLGIYKSII